MRGRHGARFSFSVCVSFTLRTERREREADRGRKRVRLITGRPFGAGHLESAGGIFFENVTEVEQTVKKLIPPPSQTHPR